jgi:putative aldouronate transport system substrate-binding protein
MSFLRTDIHTLVKQQVAAWIVGGGIESRYANFETQLDIMILKRLVEIYQTAYNQFVN